MSRAEVEASRPRTCRTTRFLERAKEAADGAEPGPAARRGLADRRTWAAGEVGAADRALDDFRALRPAIDALDRACEEISTAAERAAELKKHLGPGGFPKWLTLRRSSRLLANASRHLKRMTGGRYGFVGPRDSLERWKVADIHFD